MTKTENKTTKILDLFLEVTEQYSLNFRNFNCASFGFVSTPYVWLKCTYGT